MRNAVILAVLLLSVAARAQQDKRNALFVFVANPEYTSNRLGHTLDGTYGVGLQRGFSERWSAELMVARETNTSGYTSFGPGGTVLTRRVTHRTMPIDLSGRFHFLNETSWKPYVALGGRWVDAPSSSQDSDTMFISAGGGVVWQFRPALGLRMDGKFLLGSGLPEYADVITFSIGLSWKF